MPLIDNSREARISRIIHEYEAARNLYNKSTRLFKELNSLNHSEVFSCISDCAHKLYMVVETSLKMIIEDNEGSLSSEEIFFNTKQLCKKAQKYLDSELRIDLSCLVMEKDIRNATTHDTLLMEIQGLARVFRNTYKLLKVIDDKIWLEDVSLAEHPVDFTKIYFACDKFEDENCTYMLVTDPMRDMPTSLLSSLLTLPWNIIIDFDGKSYNGGLRSCIKSGHKTIVENYIDDLKRDGTIHNSFRLNKISWLYMELRDHSIPLEYKYWDKKDTALRKSNLDYFIKASHEVRPTKLTIFYLKKFDSSIYNFIEVVKRHYNSNIKFVFANNYDDNYMKQIENLLDENEFTFAPCDIFSILSVLSKNESRWYEKKEIDESQSINYRVPTKEEPKQISTVLIENLEDYFEIVHFDIGQNSENIEQERIDFLEGRAAAWSVFYNNFDVLPFDKPKEGYDSKYDKFINEIKSVLGNKVSPSKRIFNLYHLPGFGGTTLGRRIAWDIHRIFPVLRLKKYKYSVVSNLVEQLYDFCNKGVLIIADENDISRNDIKDFERDVKNIDRPVATLFIKRTQEKIYYYDAAPNSYLELKLIDIDAVNKLKSIYKSLAISRNGNAALLEERDRKMVSILSKDMLCPFIIGLYYLDEDFKGIKEYVGRFLSSIQDDKIKLALIYISICDYFGEKKMPSFILDKIFETPGKHLKLENIFKDINELVVRSIDSNAGVVWRPRHYLIAKELMKWLFYEKGYSDSTWTKLAFYCKEFINLLRSISKNSIPIAVSDLLSDLFINNKYISINPYQDFDDFDGNFSLIIETIPYPEQRLELLNHLVNSFDGIVRSFAAENAKREYVLLAHLWGHLARYYSKVDVNFPEAERCCKSSIEIIRLLDSHDPYIYHIYGTCISKRAYVMMKKFIKEGVESTEEDIKSIKDIVDSAAECFEIAVRYGNVEYGVISHLQILYHFINLLFKHYKVEGISQVNKLKGSWVYKYVNQSAELFGKIEPDELSNEGYSKYRNWKNQYNKLLFKKPIGDIISELNNSLDILYKSPNKDYVSIIETTKMIISMILSKYEDGKKKLEENQKDVERILKLLEIIIDNNAAAEYHYMMWFNIARLSNKSVDDAIGVMRNWHNSELSHQYRNPKPMYYLYILHILRALDGFENSLEEANRYRIECKKACEAKKSYIFINETRVRDWLGVGKGLDRLVDDKKVKFNELAEDTRIRAVNGIIIDAGDERGVSGTIEIVEPKEIQGLKVFFTPKESGISPNQNNHYVRLKFGFSYERPVAFNKSVEDINKNKEKKNNSFSQKFEFNEGDIVDFYVEAKAMNANILVGHILGTEIKGGIHFSEIKNEKTTKEEAIKLIDSVVKVVIIDNKQKNRWFFSMKKVAYTTKNANPSFKSTMTEAFEKAYRRNKDS